jgi:HAD superfamily hydrolase (TIGR01509 family)
MIQALISDMDGTLVASEHLKGESYARGVQKLSASPVDAEVVVRAYLDVVGHSSSYVMDHIMERFSITDREQLTLIRHAAYDEMIADADRVRSLGIHPTIDTVLRAKSAGLKLGLATASDRLTTQVIVAALFAVDPFDVIVTADDVSHHKPNPETYLVAARLLGLDPSECLVIEDTIVGVEAALAAGMCCLAVPNEYTLSQCEDQTLLPEQNIIRERSLLLDKLNQYLAESGSPITILP